ncbi:MAG: hypothetical protein SGI90_09235 [Candidatus Eisenbacteria bacterium]|nr:hypothetical protein [Candidatus Eisenbacteria bacterium]
MTRRYHLVASMFVAALVASPGLAVAVDIVTVESKCSSGGAYVEGGTGWGNSSSKSNKTPCSSGSRSSKNAGAFADFIPPITTAGLYDVYLTWGPTTSGNNGPNADNVEASIVHRDGTTPMALNLRGHSGCTVNSDQLVYIGRAWFNVGQGHKVRLSNTGSGQCYNGVSKRYVSADAAIFSPVAPVPVAPTTWSLIKARYAN